MHIQEIEVLQLKTDNDAVEMKKLETSIATLKQKVRDGEGGRG